ncbi:nucleotide-diphospho-sugar transferase [Cylindrobasidium torrendii FP15055 ss-10]|uniref:Nucleotide-diphospho-sugar transferase n=1 Tax=Cylindrobasidium torrendii FP15055 ss-10 TaxID=1314674 RepID=A0A0D7B6U8_9AGAR|nr:nucleotide-diphospho-sugar transferase [Cylindrobasidium torrendii FP15055 ss-10]
MSSANTLLGANGGPGVEQMFQTILSTMLKSQQDVEELRQETAQLRLSNAALEQQVRENMFSHGFGGGRTPGFMTPAAPHSPQLRSKSPFLSPGLPTTVPAIALSQAYLNPSPLGDNMLSALSPNLKSRDIPGFYVVIPAGGAGTRLWPLSREGHPKFLLDLTLKGRSLIQATWDRLIPLSSPSRTTIVAGPSHVSAICEQVPDLDANNIFCEPGPKDSMAAIGLAAAVLVNRDPDAIIGSFAADHMISGDDAFLAAVAEAVEVAKKDLLVTIGIAPSHPSTGFGYIRLGDPLGYDETPNARMVDSFKEKPDAITAAAYMRTGVYRWNAGMFVVKARFLLNLLAEYKPSLAAGLEKIGKVWDTPEREHVLSEIWPKLEKIPIDNAVAEPAAAANKVAVVPATFGWDDVGDFASLSDILPAEQNQPRILGDSSLVLTEQVYGGIVVPGSGRLISCLGVDDLVVVDLPDTLLITTRARSQEVKRVVKKVKEAGYGHLL